MKSILLILALAICVNAQTKPTHVPNELVKLRDEYASATKEYVESLGKLKASYEKGVRKQRTRLFEISFRRNVSILFYT